MAHSFIIGMTESGKSTLAKLLCKSLSEKGIKTAVLDPLHSEDWNCEYQTSDSTSFLEWAKHNKNCVLFIDEGAESVGRFNVPMQWLATQSRHWGHSCFFISQGVVQIAPIIRQQCSKFYVFACGHRNTDIIAEECREEKLRQVEGFNQGEFFVVSRFDELKRGKIIFPDEPDSSLDKIQIDHIVVSGTRGSESNKVLPGETDEKDTSISPVSSDNSNGDRLSKPRNATA